jgi:hypothetical protein
MNNYIIDSLWLAASNAISNRDIQGAKEVLQALESAKIPDQATQEESVPEFAEMEFDHSARKVNSKLAFLFDQQKYIERFFQQPDVNSQDFSVAELRGFLMKTVNTRIWRESLGDRRSRWIELRKKDCLCCCPPQA